MQAKRVIWCGVVATLLCTATGFGQLGTSSTGNQLPPPTRPGQLQDRNSQPEVAPFLRTLHIQVVDAYGRPLDGVIVAGIGPAGGLKAAEEGGVYTLTCPDAKLTLCVVADDGAEAIGDMVLPARAAEVDVVAMVNDDGTLSIKASAQGADALANGGGSNFCEGAEEITGQGLFNFDNANATTDGLSNPDCDDFGSQQIENDVWYCWTSNCDGVVQLDTCGQTGVDTKIAVYDGCSPCPVPPGVEEPGLQILDCNDDSCGLQSAVEWNAVPGNTYLIRIGTFPGADGGTGTFQIGGASCDGGGGETCNANLCVDADAISGEGTFGFDNGQATTDGPPDALCDKFGTQQIENDVWCCWTAPCTANVRFETCGQTGVDTKIAVYAGCSCDGGGSGGGGDCGNCLEPHGGLGCTNAECEATVCGADPFCCDTAWDGICAGEAADLCDCDLPFAGGLGQILACNDDDCGLQSGVVFAAVAGQQYLLRVGTFPGSGGGTGEFSLTCLDPIPNEDCENAEFIGVESNSFFVSGSTENASASVAPACDGASTAGAGGNVWYTIIGDGNEITVSTCPIFASGSDCCVSNGTPGCDDPDCQDTVCGADPFCCDVTWDGLCAAAAADLCGGLCEFIGGGADFDTQLSVFCADCVELPCVDGNDDACDFQSEVTFCSQPGAEYLVLVHGFAGAEGNFELAVHYTGEPCDGAVQCIPVGACCVGDTETFETPCVELTEAECLAWFGEYQGDGTSCDGGFLGYDVILGPDLGFQFEDISATGTEAPTASTSDDGGDVIDLPFEFCFFDNFYNSVGIASNGYLTFGGNLGDFTNDPIPNATDPNDLIAPYWDDWSPNQGGTVQYEARTSPDRFIVQWTDVPHFNSVGQSTFQAILFADGAIEFHYDGVIIDSPTVGIENADGTDGIDVTGQAPPSVRFEKLTGEAAICEVPGACCWDEGCLIVLENECLALPGGNFLGEGTDCTPDDISDPGLYILHNHPVNSQAPPPYGLRLDELIDVTGGHDVFTFDFDAPGVTMYLCYDGSSIRIYGTAFGGRDSGVTYDAAYSGLAYIDFLYDTGVGLDPLVGADALVVDASAAGLNSGTVQFLPTDCCSAHAGAGCEDPDCELLVCNVDPSCCDTGWDADCADLAAVICIDCSGEVFSIYDYEGNNPITFRFGSNGLALNGNGGPMLEGTGWLVHPNPDSVYILANDWVFVGEPFQGADPNLVGRDAGRASRPSASGPSGSTGGR